MPSTPRPHPNSDTPTARCCRGKPSRANNHDESIWPRQDLGFSDASPYVCKLVMWLRLAKLDYQLIYVPWPEMIERAPRKSVPWIEDVDGEVIHDSQRIIDRLSSKHGVTLDAHLSRRERAQMRAWQRLLEDHYYWAGLSADALGRGPPTGPSTRKSWPPNSNPRLKSSNSFKAYATTWWANSAATRSAR